MTRLPQVSSATPDDYDACARLFERLEVPDPVWTRARFVEAVMPDAVVLREESLVTGYAWARPRGDVFHVVHVVIDTERRGRGYGDLLMTAIAARARAAGLTRWMLNVKPENVAARRLYEKHGMRARFEAASVRFDWSRVSSLESVPGVSTRLLTASDDAAFENACGLARGEIASLRDAQSRVTLGVIDERGAPLGFAAFDTSFPGLSPVRARVAGVARALLEAARPHARNGEAWLRVFAEDDPSLEEALVRAGGEIVLRALRMEGEV